MALNTFNNLSGGAERRLASGLALALALAGVLGPVSAWAQESLRAPVSSSQRAANQDPTTGFTAAPAPSEAPVAVSADPQPLASLASVGTDYRIGPNDLLEFDVFGVPGMARTIRVNSTGVVSLPLVGAVPLAGLTAQQAEAMLAERYAKDFFQNPSVSLFIKEFTTQRITIEGAVLKPGIYPVTGQITLLRALALAGGYASFADQKTIMLYRAGPDGQQLSQSHDLEKVRAGEVPDPLIQSDDVIVVKRDPKRTALRDSLFSDFLSTINPFSR